MYAIRSYYVCLCGEMASDPMNFLVLYGMGINEFSMPAPFIPRIKTFLRKMSSDLAKRTTAEILTMSESAKIRSHVARVLKELS